MNQNQNGMDLAAAAAACGGTVVGDGGTEVRGISSLADAGPKELGLLASRRYLEAAPASGAGAFLVSEALADALGDPRPRLVVADAHAALVPLLRLLHPPREPVPGVHPSAVVGRGVRLGESVTVGPYAVLGDGADVGAGCVLHAHVVVGAGCRIGPGSTLHPHVTLYRGSELGARVTLHAGVRIGSDGFGYAFLEGEHRKVPQVGRCVVEDDVEIGANSCVDRGSIGATVVGRGSKLDNLVHIAHNVRLGPRCILTAHVGIAGSTRVGEGVMWAGQSGASGHLEIGAGARIGAKAGVMRDVAPGETVLGFPARESGAFMRATALTYKLPQMSERLRALEREVEALRAALGPRDGT